MSNITLAVDDVILKKVRRAAVERNTTVSGLVRESLEQWAAREDLRTEELIKELQDSFNQNTVCVGKKNWRREELHDR